MRNILASCWRVSSDIWHGRVCRYALFVRADAADSSDRLKRGRFSHGRPTGTHEALVGPVRFEEMEVQGASRSQR